jgi:hypothetical protein
MKHLLCACVLLAAFLAACTSTSATRSADIGAGAWAADATWTDACCCKVPCPCLFGTGPTEGYCEGASIFEIERGHYDGVSLDGLAALVTYRVGGWTKLFVTDAASAEQAEAFGALLPYLLPFVVKGAEPVVTREALTIEREGRTVRYSAGESRVEMTMLESSTGEPIVLENLPAKGTPFADSHGHTQYKSKVLAHESELGTFEYTGRNGFSSQLSLSGSSARR